MAVASGVERRVAWTLLMDKFHQAKWHTVLHLLQVLIFLASPTCLLLVFIKTSST